MLVTQKLTARYHVHFNRRICKLLELCVPGKYRRFSYVLIPAILLHPFNLQPCKPSTQIQALIKRRWPKRLHWTPQPQEAWSIDFNRGEWSRGEPQQPTEEFICCTWPPMVNPSWPNPCPLCWKHKREYSLHWQALIKRFSWTCWVNSWIQTMNLVEHQVKPRAIPHPPKHSQSSNWIKSKAIFTWISHSSKCDPKR